MNVSQKICLDIKVLIFTAECSTIHGASDITKLCDRTNFLNVTDFLSVIKSIQKTTFCCSINIQLIEIKNKYATFVAIIIRTILS